MEEGGLNPRQGSRSGDRPCGEAKVDGKTRHFGDPSPYFCASVVNSDGKVANGTRVPTKPQRAAWYFLESETPGEIISTNIYMYTYIHIYIEFPTVAPNYWHRSMKHCGTLAPTVAYFL